MNISKTKVLIKIFCAENNLNQYNLAQAMGIAPQHFSRKITTGKLKLEEFLNLLDQLGYTIKIKKKE